MKRIIQLTLLLMAIMLPVVANAHDFVENGIYYNILNDNEVAVTYRGASYNEYSNEYSGDVTIPATVTYNGTTYSVTSIGIYAFHGCSGLTTVTIPSSVTSIGSYAFYGCTSLTTLNYNAVFCDDFGSSGGPFYNLNISTINIGDSVKRIPAYFASCLRNLISITIPNSVTSIGSYAFSGCSGLTGVNITSLEAWLNISFNTGLANPLNYAHHLYLNSVEVKDLVIPSTITSINEYAFYGCSGLTTVTIPSSVTSIGSSAFSGCSGLTTVTIPSSVTSIGEYAFRSCSGLTSVSIGNSVTSIGSYAFEGCSSLTDVYSYIIELPITMGDQCFYLSSWDYTGRTLHVPQGTLDDYQAMPRWKAYFGAIVEMDVVVPALDYVFDMPDTTVQHGETIVIPVRLTNSEEIMAFQTDLFLPEDFNLVVDEDDEYMVTPSGRLSSDHILMTQDVSNGAVRLLCYAPNGTPFMGNQGDLFYLHIQVPDNAGGDYTLSLSNTLLTTSDYNELSIPDAEAVLTANTFIPGDVNDSHTVTVTDIVVTAQYIMELNPSPFIFAAADMNEDENISVTDIALIAYVVNHPTMSALHRMPALTAGSDRMSGDGLNLMAGETRTVSITLDNAMDYSAFQLDLMLPDGLTASNFALTDRAGSHTLVVNALANGKTRVLCYSPAIAAIEGDSGALLTFDVTANAAIDSQIAVDGIELVTTDCRTVLLDGFAIGVNNATGVNVLDGSKTVSRVDYYNLAGQRVERPESGVTLKVTTYTDGTRTTTKIFQ